MIRILYADPDSGGEKAEIKSTPKVKTELKKRK